MALGVRLEGDAALRGVIDDDQDLLEERLVEHSLDVLRSCFVGLAAVFCQVAAYQLSGQSDRASDRVDSSGQTAARSRLFRTNPR
jgi:hypothetical protein